MTRPRPRSSADRDERLGRRAWNAIDARIDCLPARVGVDRRTAGLATLVSVTVAVLLLVGQAAVGAAVTGSSQPMAVTDRVPRAPDAPAWNDAPNRTVELSKQQMALPHGGGSVDRLEVQAITNRTHVAFRLSWEDPTNDTAIDEPRAYSDAAAVMLGNGEKPPITMGAVGSPVNIWYWRASWEYGEPTGTAMTAGDAYAYPHPSNETKPGQAAGNPLSKARYEQYGQNYYAKGYGSLTHAPAQNVHAHGERTDDGWTVVLVRERSTDGAHDATFDGSENVYLAFAVWNGSADEANGQKSLTMQFSTLDTQNGSLSRASSDGSEGNDSAGSIPSGDGAGSMGWFWSSVGPVLAATTIAWLVAYRSIRRRERG